MSVPSVSVDSKAAFAGVDRSTMSLTQARQHFSNWLQSLFDRAAALQDTVVGSHATLDQSGGPG